MRAFVAVRFNGRDAAGRIAVHAEANEILVSGPVKELVAGSVFEFTDRARHKLKGLPHGWPLYARALMRRTRPSRSDGTAPH